MFWIGILRILLTLDIFAASRNSNPRAYMDLIRNLSIDNVFIKFTPNSNFNDIVTEIKQNKNSNVMANVSV